MLHLDWPAIIVCTALLPYLMYGVGEGRKNARFLRFVLRTNRVLYDILKLVMKYMQERGRETCERLKELEKLDR